MTCSHAARAALLLLLTACPDSDDRRGDRGAVCALDDDCIEGLACASDLTCRLEGEPGTAEIGATCVGTSMCRAELVCGADGTCADPGTAGTAGFDETCATDDDCQFGLTCAESGVCKGLQLPLWFGAACEDEEAETGPYRVYFEVPGDEPLADFYRLPFPTDARVDDDGMLDLSGHPVPDVLPPVAGNPVGNLIRVIEQDLGGRFGQNQAVFFRFSAFPDPDTLSFGLPGEGTMALVDVTPGADADRTHPVGYVLDSGRTPYICDNWLAMYPIDGRPLEPGHTYAAILTRGIRSDDGGAELTQDDDFAAMLGDAAPSDAHLERAWLRHAPLRAWLDERAVDPGSLAAAAVFTVQEPLARAQQVFDAVQAEATPVLTDTVVCGEGDDPFAAPGDQARGCTGGSDLFHEIQGIVGLPRFQVGTAPYKDFGDGGQIPVTEDGVAPEGLERVHVTLTVPKGVPMPEGGWPVVLYGHGTGGSYTSVVRSGFADEHTVTLEGDDAPVHFAMLGFDAPLHGPRANPDAWKQTWLDVDPHAYDPDVLFFNPLNVRAARDNALQQAADLWSLTRFLAGVDLAADASPLGEALRFDADHVYYVGHSQGAVVGPLFLALDPVIDGAVLSGGGGLTMRAFLEKTSPNPLLPALRVALADPEVDRVHPVLNLAQQVADGVDGVNHGRYVLREPVGDNLSKPVLQVFGVGDTYSPDSTQRALARALGVEQVPNNHTPLESIGKTELPASDNVGGTTGVVVLYAAAGGEDAHFVLFERDDAREHVSSFLGTAVRDGAPTVVQAAP